MEEVIQGVLPKQGNEDLEEAVGLGHDLPCVYDVLLQDEPQYLDDLYPPSSDLGAGPRIHVKLLAALGDEVLEELLELCDDGFVFREDEGDAGEVGEEDGGIVDGDVLLLAHHVFDDLGDHFQGEECVVELVDLVVPLQVGRSLLDDLAHVGRQVAQQLSYPISTYISLLLDSLSSISLKKLFRCSRQMVVSLTNTFVISSPTDRDSA